MGAGAAVAAVGVAVAIYGQRQANSAAAKAERANAAAYDAQRKMNLMSARREADIFSTESRLAIGDVVNSIDLAGIDLEDSSLLKVANMKAQAGREYNAIRAGAQINSSILAMRAAQANRTAAMLGSDLYNGIQSAGTILNATSKQMES